MSGHRHAASVLYGVSADDREAVLAGLPAADRQILRGHLEELAGLGFDPAAMRQATLDSVPPKPVPVRPAAAAPSVSPADRIRAASAASVAAVLAHEPAALVTDVLALEAWPWSVTVRAALPPASRIALRLQNGRPAPAPAMRAALLALLADALAARPLEEIEEFAGADSGAGAALETEAVPASLLGRIGNRLSAWTR